MLIRTDKNYQNKQKALEKALDRLDKLSAILVMKPEEGESFEVELTSHGHYFGSLNTRLIAVNDSYTLAEAFSDKEYILSAHSHESSEHITLVEGSMTELRTNITLSVGDTMIIRPHQIHECKFLPNTKVIVMWMPPLKTKTNE